jgi:arylsulfatase A-like enzyme/Flp pilus assembly protein TadD
VFVRWQKGILLGLLAVVVAAGVVLWWLGSRARPLENLLLITLDTCRADHLGCYGYKQTETSTLDDLARRGFLFCHAVTTSPLTLTAHASILTGTYPTFHKVRNNMDFQLPKGIRTLAEELKSQGYVTGAVISGSPLESSFGLDRGFDFYDDAFTRVNFDLSQEREVGIVPLKNEKRAEEATAVAISWLRANAGKKFFLWVHYFDPHTEYSPPEPFASRYKSRLYDGEIAYMDQSLGRLIRHMADSRILDHTVVAVVGDHGEGLNEHDEPTHGIFVYQSVLRVPFILCAPGLLPSNARWDPQVRVVDIAPTVLDLLDIPCHMPVQGRSLVAMLTGREPGQHLTNYAETFLPFFSMGWSPLRALNAGRWKYIHAPKPELYDLDSDPGELQNAAASHEELLKQMKKELASIVAETSEVRPEQVTLDPRVLESIRSLGYVGGVQKLKAGASLDVSGLKDPKDMQAVAQKIYQGLVSVNTGHLPAALRSFREAIAADPTNVMAWRMVEDIYLRKRDFPGAMDACKRVAELLPAAPSAHHKLGCLLCEVGDLEGGLAEFKKSLELDPQFASGHYGIGMVRFKQGRYAEARREYETALELAPRLTQAAIGVAASMERSGSASGAIDFLRAQTQRQPKDSYLYLALGQTYRRLSRFGEAVEAFKTGALLEPDNPYAYLDLAETYMEMGDFNAALPRLHDAARLAPLAAEVRHKLGKYYYLTGRYAEAEAELRKAVAAEPRLALALNDLGAVLQMQGRPADAMAQYQKAVAADPNLADAWQNLGLVSFAQGRFEEAVKYLKNAARLKPDDPNAVYQLAVACLKAGRVKEAEEAIQQALTLNPSHEQARALLKEMREPGKKQ